MATSFSPIKAFKLTVSSLAIAGACLLSTATSAQYVKTNGSQIVDENGNPLFFNGTNLGNWLVWEGYMMMDDSLGRNGVEYRTHSQFFISMQAALGNDFDKAREFERLWRLNYVTKETIDELIGLGYNSVRVPFNFRLFWDERANKPSWEGFEYIDNLISYCRGKNMRILLDMHGAPGYQNPGDHSDNMDSNANHPIDTVRFLDGTDGGYYGTSIGANVRKAADVWRHIADYYKDEPVIWGYDLLNEPVTKNKSEDLWRAYAYIINAIRQVDRNHTVVVEGDNWASHMDMFDFNRPQLDPNLVLETHHYVFGDANKADELYGRAALAEKLNLPIIIGEIGEDKEEILRKMANIGKEKYDGVFSWSFKKMFKEYRSLWIIKPDPSYAEDRAYINLRDAIDRNTTMVAVSGGQSTFEHLKSFLTNNIRNKHPRLGWWQKFYDATTNPINITVPGCTRSPYKTMTIPNTIEAEDFDNGCAGSSYSDTTTGSTGGASYRSNTDVDIAHATDNGNSGYSIGWTAGNEWVEYTVDVKYSGKYTVNYRVSSPYSGNWIKLSTGSTSITTNLNPTGGWGYWATSPSTHLTLPAGTQVIRLTFSGGFDLNNFTITPDASVLPDTGNFAIISRKSTKALDIPNNATTLDGAKVQQWTRNWSDNQKWIITRRNGSVYNIINVASKKALDLPDGSTENKTSIQQWAFYSTEENQQWLIVKKSNGAFAIIAQKSQKALDLPGGSSTDGVQIQQWDYSDSNTNQEWDIVPQ